jgi:hypothetical protein
MSRKKKENVLTYKGEDYELVFNLNVMEDIQEIYGSVEAWGSLIEPEDGKEPKAKDIKYGFTAMINEGIDMYNEDHEEKREFLTDKQVGRMISEFGLQAVAQLIGKTVVDSTKSDEKNS